jgi:hypothetical protein
LFYNQGEVGTGTFESCICGFLQSEDFKIKMGMTNVTMVDGEEGANALGTME